MPGCGCRRIGCLRRPTGTLTVRAGWRRVLVRGPDGQLVGWESGDRAGPPVLFLHGLSFGAGVWQRQLDNPRLQRFRMVAMDLRGHGESDVDPTGKYGERQWADDLRAVFAQLRVHQAVVVAWSFGAVALAAYLKTFRDTEETVRAIHLVAPGTWSGQPGAVEPFDRRLTSERTDEAAAGVTAFVRDCSLPDSLTHADEAFLTGWVHRTAPSTRAALLGLTLDYRPLWHTIRTPVLLTYGDRDTVFDPAGAESVAGGNPAVASVVHQGAGHLGFWHDPDRFGCELIALVGAGFSHRT